MTTSGRTTKLDAMVRSWEGETIEEALSPSHNVFNRLGQSRGEDIRTNLEVRHTSATSKRRKDLPVVSPIHDEINELRAMFKKLVAGNTGAAQSTSILSFRMPTIATYEDKTDPQDHLDAFTDQMDLLQVSTIAHCRCFAVMLSGTTKKWIRQIEPETIVSWRQLSSMFMR